MKKLNYLWIIAVIMAVSCMPVYAQVNDLSEEDLAEFKYRTEKMIDQFQENLSIIGSKEQKNTVKDLYVKTTLKMFIGEGERYRDLNSGEWLPPAHMQVSSIRYGIESKPRNVDIKQYLNNLRALPYAKVKITQAQTFQLSNFYKVGDHYEGTATIFQKFCGYLSDGSKKYCDVTQKTIKIYVTKEVDAIGKHWAVKFGDIDVVETTDI